MTGLLKTFWSVSKEAGLRQALRSALAVTSLSASAQSAVFVLVSSVAIGAFIGTMPLIASIFMAVDKRLPLAFFVTGTAIALIGAVLRRCL